MGYLRNLAAAFLNKPSGMTPASGYNAATLGRRTLNIGQSSRGPDSLALADGQILLSRARKASMDNPLVVTGVGAFVAEVIGTGIRPHSKHSDPIIRRELEKEFALWVPQASAKRRVGPGGKPDSAQSFYQLQSLVCRNVIIAGEAFARLRPRLASDLSRAGLRVPLQLDLIEPEQLAMWRMSGENMAPNSIMRGSIEFDQIGQVLAYHFYRHHPGDASVWPNTWEVTRVPAESILHLMEYLQGAQIRGITSLAPILIALQDFDDFDDAERFRQKLGAYLFAWKKTLQPDDAQLAAVSNTAGNDQAPDGAAYVEMQPGEVTVVDTNAGEEMGFYAHPGVPNGYEAFTRIQRQTFAAAMRITYDMLTGDNSSTTFMNTRVRLIALRRIWQQFQSAVMEHQFNRPVWRAWLDAAALVGVIDAVDYRKNPEEYLNVEWSAQPWDWVDPIKDVESKRMEIESCLTSREKTVSERGEDVEEVDAAIARDHEREKKLGIFPVYGASRAAITEPPGDNGENDTPPTAQPSSAPAKPKPGAPKK